MAFLLSPRASVYVYVHSYRHVNLIQFSRNRIFSPLLFCLIVMSVTSLVHAANSILIEGSSSASWAGLVSNWFNLAYQTVQLFLLQLGQDLYDRIAERKAKLNKMVSLMPVSISKLQLSDIVESLSIWKWEMTAVSISNLNNIDTKKNACTK